MTILGKQDAGSQEMRTWSRTGVSPWEVFGGRWDPGLGAWAGDVTVGYT